MDNLKLAKTRWKLSSCKIKQKEKEKLGTKGRREGEKEEKKLEDSRVKVWVLFWINKELLPEDFFFFFQKLYFCLYSKLHVHTIVLIAFLLEREMKH